MAKAKNTQKTNVEPDFNALLNELLQRVDWDIYKMYDEEYAEVPEEVQGRRDDAIAIIRKYWQ
jgi:hypothetical protein